MDEDSRDALSRVHHESAEHIRNARDSIAQSDEHIRRSKEAIAQSLTRLRDSPVRGSVGSRKKASRD